MSARSATRLQVVSGAGGSHLEAVFQPRAPGIGARYLSSLGDAARVRGWHLNEVAGLLAAAEERSTLWIVSGRRPIPHTRVTRWQAGTLVPAGDLDRVLALTGAAASHGAVCLAAVSGPAPARLLQCLAQQGARLGRARSDPATIRTARWSIELLRTPMVFEDTLPALREQLASAPRCGWCRMPVLGTACRRCMEDPR